MVPMTDGIELYCRIFLPGDGEPQPTIFFRTPYEADSYISSEGVFWSSNGFNVVLQDVRGRYKSQGEFNFFETAAIDSKDTMDWIGKQSWSNQKIFIYCLSSAGITQYLQPLLAHPYLKGQSIGVAGPSFYTTAFQNGALRVELVVIWSETYNTMDALKETIDHEALTSYWNTQIFDQWDQVDYPAFHYTGWYDVFQQPQLDAYMGYQYESSAPGTNFLLIGPGGHCGGSTNSEFAWPEADKFWSLRVDISQRMFVQLNKSDDLIEYKNALADISPVTYYILGPDTPDAIGNFWAYSDSYPPYETKPYELYLSSNSRLDRHPSATEGSTTYTFDPTNPVPTIGGDTLFITCGPRDQSSLNDRKDIISFTSDPFPDGLFMCGKLKVSLYVSSDAVDTDFTAKLVDVYPDNRNMLVQDGIIRMRWRDSQVTPSTMTSGTVYSITVDLWSMCYVLNANHKLRLDISSSNYPRFDVNPNTGLMLNQPSPNVTAQNTIYFGGSYPSKLIIDKPLNQSILIRNNSSGSTILLTLYINVCLMILILCLLS